MNLVLGQSDDILPAMVDGERKIGTWQQAKALTHILLGYKIRTPEVLAFHQSDARIRIIEAPARGSKSFTTAYDIPGLCLPSDPPTDVLVWLIGATHRMNKEFDYLWKIFVENEPIWKASGFPFEMKRATNSPTAGDREIRFVKQRDSLGRPYHVTIQGLSAENEKTIQGEQVTYAVMSEAAEQSEHILSKYLEQRTRYIVLPTTPKPRAAWLKDLRDQSFAHPEMGVRAFTFRSHRHPEGHPEAGKLYNANPRYQWDLYEQAEAAALVRARRDYGKNATAEDDPYFAEQYLGRWVYYSGRVLPFERRRHVVSPHAFGEDLSRYKVTVSTDYGIDHPACALFWAILPGPVFFLFDSIYERGLTSEKFVSRIHQHAMRNGITVSDYVGDPRRPEVEIVMRDAGLPVVTTHKRAQSDRAAGYRRLIDLLTEGPCRGFPGIFVSSSCTRVIEEWEGLHYREGYRNEFSTEAILGADHGADAARYFLMTRPRAEQPIDDFDFERFVRDRRRDYRRAHPEQGHLRALGAHRYAA